jgi:hypothetical protein
MWLIDRLIQQNAQNVEKLCIGMLRQIRPEREEDIGIIEHLLALLKKNE